MTGSCPFRSNYSLQSEVHRPRIICSFMNLGILYRDTTIIGIAPRIMLNTFGYFFPKSGYTASHIRSI